MDVIMAVIDRVKYWLVDIWSYSVSASLYFFGAYSLPTPQQCDVLDSYFRLFAHLLTVVIGGLTLTFITIPKTYKRYKEWRRK